MPDIAIPLTRPAFPLKAQGNYKRTVDGIDLSDMVNAVHHMYGVDAMCAACLSVHYNYNTGGATIVDASAEVHTSIEWSAHPAGRDLVLAVLAQVSTSRSTPGTIDLELWDITDPADPTELDAEVGMTLTAGQQFDRTTVDGIPPQRFFILPVVASAAATTTPDRMLSYEPLSPSVWADGFPYRTEARLSCTGIRPATVMVFTVPRGTIEEAA